MDLGDRSAGFRFLVRARAAEFSVASAAVLAAAGVQVLKIPPPAPMANAYAERWVRTVRTECLDWLLIRNLHDYMRLIVAEEYPRMAIDEVPPNKTLGDGCAVVRDGRWPGRRHAEPSTGPAR